MIRGLPIILLALIAAVPAPAIEGEHSGTISVGSDPAGAQVFLDGIGYSGKTPVAIGGVSAGRHLVEVRLDKYRFAQRTVFMAADSVTRLSFSLFSDMDTVFVRGAERIGILILAQQAMPSAYRVDSVPVSDLTVRLSPGQHRIQWHGTTEYRPLDTLLNIPAGIVSYLDFRAEQLFGQIAISLVPPDARLFLNDSLVGAGDQMLTLPVRTYRVHAARRGYRSRDVDIEPPADTVGKFFISLEMVPDQDGDGFTDSLDLCPRHYGIYDGCPSPRLISAVKTAAARIHESAARDSFAIGWMLAGYLHRTAMDSDIRRFLSHFEGAAFNNYQGLAAGNSLFASLYGLFVSLELGQWLGGLKYHALDTISWAWSDKTYLVYLDTLDNGNRTEPRILITSTAVAAGAHFPLAHSTFAFGVGYQWETFAVGDLREQATGEKTRLSLRNDWWFSDLRIERDFHADPHLVPSLFFDFKLTLGEPPVSAWAGVQAGLMLKFTGVHRSLRRH
jgi:hypothetical protein